MNFHNLEYFIAITEERNISKAAERLHVSQQSLSEQLKKIESEVGAVLIKRGQPLTLTAAGEVFLKSARHISDSYKATLDEINTISEKEKSRLIVAVPTTETPPFLPGLLKEFSSVYPNISVRIIKCEPKEAARHASEFDLYFSRLPLGDDLENIYLTENETYVAAFTESLAKRIYGDNWDEVEEKLKQEKDLNIIKDIPFVILCNRFEETVLDIQIIFRDAGFIPNIAFQSDNSELNCNMCRLGTGAYISTIGYCRHVFWDDLTREDGIRLYPINSPIDPVLVALSHRKGMKLSKSAKCFIETARQYLSQPPHF